MSGVVDELVRRLGEARRIQVTVNEFRFTLLRPTDMEAAELSRENVHPCDIASRFVVDWAKADGSAVVARDIVPAGGAERVRFDPKVWSEWLSDRSEFWLPIAKAVAIAYSVHQKRRENAVIEMVSRLESLDLPNNGCSPDKGA